MKRLTAVLSSLLITAGLLMSMSTVFAAGPNLVANPGLETASGTAPANWTSNKWGSNTAAFTYDTTGHSGSRAATVKVSAYASGDAKWSFAPVNVTPNTTYTFSNWYKSTAVSGVVAAVTPTSGAVSYTWIANAPVSAAWKQQSFSFKAPANAKQVTFLHYLDKNGTLSVDDYSLTADDGTTTPPPVNTPPTVNVSGPISGATVSDTINVTANATDNQSVVSVQFKLDGANLGAADTTAPYSTPWDTKTIANGSHSLTAVAIDNQGVSATSAAVPVTVSNVVTPPVAGNLVANPSAETANGAVPANWISNSWGTNTSNLTYETNGQDGSRSLKATISSYTNGDAKWYFAPVAVTPNAAYNYSQWYKSNVETEVDAMVTMKDGTVQYFWLGSVPANPTNWQKLNYQFTAPANAATVTIFHVVSKVGYVQVDNVTFAQNSPASTQFDRGLVSLTFDDGWRNIHTNGLPLLKKYGLASTQYLNSEPIIGGYPDYMTYQMVKDFSTAGHELGWHTRSHADITTLTAANLNTELTIPPAFLTGVGQPASAFKHFASPYGAYNPTSVSAVMGKYQSHRSTDVGYNSKASLDVKNIKVQNITNTTTPADVQSWVNQALANKTWLVIVYHEVTATAADPTYAVTPANLDAELNIIKQSGVTVKTLDQALAEITPQL